MGLYHLIMHIIIKCRLTVMDKKKSFTPKVKVTNDFVFSARHGIYGAG